MLRKTIRRFYSNIRVQIDKSNHAAWLTLCQPHKRNPLSLKTINQIHQGLLQIEAASQKQVLKIMILKGEGSVFSAGHDLLQLKNSQQPQVIFKECMKMMIKLKRFPLITICAANNMATAAGLQLALTCDLIIASKSASFGIPGMKRGLFPSTPLVQLQRCSKSESNTKDIVIFGDMLTADQAFQRGLVNNVVQDGQLDAQVKLYIERAKKLSAEVIAHGKSVIDRQSILLLEEAYSVAIEGMKDNILLKEDCREGLAAFAEKRVPKFKK